MSGVDDGVVVMASGFSGVEGAGGRCGAGSTNGEGVLVVVVMNHEYGASGINICVDMNIDKHIVIFIFPVSVYITGSRVGVRVVGTVCVC